MMGADMIRLPTANAVNTSILAGLSIALSACAGGPSAQPGFSESAPDPQLGQDGYVQVFLGQDYEIRPTDTLRITVFREEGLSFDSIMVSAEGQISFPLMGPIKVAGMTPAALENFLEEGLGETFLNEPDVTVNMLEYASHRVTVEGQVENPGIFSFVPGTRLSGGISLASGPTRVAKLSDVAVFRQTNDGIAVAKFDYAAVQAGTMLDPVLLPGDRIVVGTSGLSRFWQDFLQSIPVFALFTRI